ncbi:8145_t:CDS:2, partial [Diversispora eburnea]
MTDRYGVNPYIFDPFVSEFLTEQELFKVVIPIPEVFSIKTTDTVKLATRKVPNEPILNQRVQVPSTEDSAIDMFLKLMDAINNQRLICLERPESWRKRYGFGRVKGCPDAIRRIANNINLLKNPDASQILSIVEIKPEQLMRNLIGYGVESSEAYNTALTVDDDGSVEYARSQKIIKIVRQTFGYMVVTYDMACLRHTFEHGFFTVNMQSKSEHNLHFPRGLYSISHSSPPNIESKLGNDVTTEEKKLAILGLQTIHTRGVMHGDIRLENIMVKRDELVGKTLVWWIDFAWSKMECSEKDQNIELKRFLGMT